MPFVTRMKPINRVSYSAGGGGGGGTITHTGSFGIKSSLTPLFYQFFDNASFTEGALASTLGFTQGETSITLTKTDGLVTGSGCTTYGTVAGLTDGFPHLSYTPGAGQQRTFAMYYYKLDRTAGTAGTGPFQMKGPRGANDLEYDGTPRSTISFYHDRSASSLSFTNMGYIVDPFPIWVASTPYTSGTKIQNFDSGAGVSKAWLCITSGTSAGSGGPTGSGSNVTDGTAHWQFMYNVNDGRDDNGGSEAYKSFFRANDWNMVEIDTYFGTVDNSDGYIKPLYNGSIVGPFTGTAFDTNAIPFRVASNQLIDYISIFPGVDSIAPNDTYRVRFCDYYVDNTPEIIVLGNASTWGACRWKIPLIPTAWNGNVTATMRKFPGVITGGTVYSYVRDASGTVSSSQVQVAI